MKGLWQDVSYSLRTLLKNPGFAAVVVLTLALGIGANTAVFSVVNALLFKPMPVDRPEQLAALYITETDSQFPDSFSYPDYVDYRDRNQAFSDLVGHSGTTLSLAEGNKSAGTQPELIWGEVVTGNYFTGLGVRPATGRVFTQDDDRRLGAHPVTVLSYAFWQRRFGGDPSVIGRVLKLNGHDFTVIGVATYGFSGTRFLGFIPDAWVPLMMHAQVMRGSENWLNQRDYRFLNVNGRMKPGVTISQAAAGMNLLARQIEQAYPQFNRNTQIKIMPGGHKTQPLPGGDNILTYLSAMLMGVVSLALLIACANVANLMLAKATARRREIAIRLALGASRWRLIRQVLIESLMLSILGGGLGLLLAWWFTDLFKDAGPQLEFATVNPDYDLAMDHRILIFTLVISVATGVIFGLLPAMQASKPDLVPTLKGEEASVGRGLRRFSLRNLLVVAQVTLSLMLLVSAGLFVRSARNLQHINPGFDTKNLLIASVDLDVQGYNAERGQRFYKQVVERIEQLPGVQSATVAAPLPLDTSSNSTQLQVEGYVPRSADERIQALYTTAGPKYFQTMGTPLVQGREFDERDKEGSLRVVIVNETMAERYWPGQNPIGKRIRFDSANSPYLEVIGVAKDGKYITLGEATLPYMFLPMLQNYGGSNVRIVIRSQNDPAALVSSLRHEVRGLDETLPVFGVKTIEQFMERPMWGTDKVAGYLSGLGLLALLMAAMGLYGVMSYAVARRTREIGVRIALGARGSDVVRLIVKQGMALVAIGVVIGVAASFALTRLLSSMLYGMDSADPWTFAGIAALLSAASLLACYLPARRAAGVDPMVVLRYE